jgi:NAD(P)H-flavin reductase
MPAQEFKCVVKSFKMLTPTVFETVFEGHLASDPSVSMTFQAGQFVSIVIPGAGPNGRDLRRAYSIASAPETHPVELCVKLVEGGPGTNYLYKLREGDTFKGFAPYGDFLYRTHSAKNACFIATGTGIAPFRSMVFSEKFKSDPPQKAYCFLGVRTESELIYVDEFKNMPNMHFVPAVSQPDAPWSGFKGRVTEYMRGLAHDFPWRDTEYYLCGSGPMITETKTFLGEKGVAKEHIHVEKYY